MDLQPFDRFFHFASRFVIIFPIIAVVLILLFTKNPFEKKESSVVPTPVAENDGESKSFDLDASYICNVSEKSGTTSAYIKNRSVRANISEKGIVRNIIFSDDCLYSWEKNKTSGEKTCGLSHYVSLFETMNQMGLADPDSLLESFLNKKTATGSSEVASFDKACKKQEVKNETLFQIPKNVKFVDKKAEGK